MCHNTNLFYECKHNLIFIQKKTLTYLELRYSYAIDVLPKRPITTSLKVNNALDRVNRLYDKTWSIYCLGRYLVAY
jgi:hypothetical protein